MIFTSGSDRYIPYFIKEKYIEVTEHKAIFFQDKYPLIDLNGLKSISFMEDRVIWITEDGTLYAKGENSKGQINGSQHKLAFEYLQKSVFDDKNLRFSSVVCGNDFTLYLTMSDNPSLLFVNSLVNEGKPTVIPLLDHQKPISLFGGELHCGAIDSSGSSIIINPTDQHNILYLTLPNDEKIVSLSFCNEFLLALSSTGKVYSSEYLTTSHFKEVEELKNIKINQITGKSDHAIAVSADGRAFSKGCNSHGQLGCDISIQKSNKFIQIDTIDPYYKVIDAYAGYNSSYFILDDGKLLYCGDRESDSMAQSHQFVDFVPSETFICKGCNFCILGKELTIIFVDCKPPINTPNKRIGECFSIVQKKSGNESTSILKNSFLWKHDLYVQSKETLEIENGYVRVFNYLCNKDKFTEFKIFDLDTFMRDPEIDNLLYHLTGDKFGFEIEIGEAKYLYTIFQYSQKISDIYELNNEKKIEFLQQILYLFVLRDITISNLLKKCNAILRKYNIHINNFNYDFRDGNIFLILIRLATSDDKINYLDSIFSEEKLKDIIVKSKIPYLLESHSIAQGNSCLIMFQTYAIIERISEEKFDYNNVDDFIFYDKYSPLLNAINGICSNKFGFVFTKLENLMYGPDLIRFINLLLKDPYLDEILSFSPTSIIRLKYSKKIFDFILDYLKKKDDIFKIRPFYFGQINEKYDTYNFNNIKLSIDQFFTSLLDKFFIKSTEAEMFKRCNILLGKKKQITSISDFKDGIAFVYLLGYLIDPLSNEILNTVSFEMIIDYFQKAKVVMIVNESILISPEANRNFILYQLQFIFNAIDQSFSHMFIEYLKSNWSLVNRIKVPDYSDLKNAILANRYFLSLKNTHKKEHELKLEKRSQLIKHPQTYKERYNLNEQKNKIKTSKNDDEDLDDDDNDVEDDDNDVEDDDNDVEDDDNDVEDDDNDVEDDDDDVDDGDDGNIENESKESFWNSNNVNFGFENGIIIDKSHKFVNNNYDDEFRVIFHNNQSQILNSKYKKSTTKYSETAEHKLVYYWNSDDCDWMRNEKASLFAYGYDRKTPIVLFMDSDEDEIINLISNTINQNVDRVSSDMIKDYKPEQYSIFGSCIATSQLSKYTFNIDKKKKTEYNEIFPLFIFTNVNNDNNSDHSRLETALLRFYSTIIKESHLVVIILKENYISHQIETIKNIYLISKYLLKEIGSHPIPVIDFLFVVNSQYVSFDHKAADLFISKIRQEFDFNSHFCFINIDNKESYKPFVDKLNEILIKKTRVIYKKSHVDKLDSKHLDVLSFRYSRLLKKARKLDKEEKEKNLPYYNYPTISLPLISILTKLSGLYMRIIVHPEIYDAKSIIYKRYKILRKRSLTKNSALRYWDEEMIHYTFAEDERFAKIVNDVKFLISTGGGSIKKKIQKELKISSDQRLKYLESILNDRLYWTTAQLTVMKNSHIKFLKKEFLDIIFFENDKAVTYAFNKFGSIFENQLQSDKMKIDLMFKNFFLMIEKKKKTSIKEMKDEMKKSTSYILKERESMKEIKVALEVGQNLESIIPQDF